MSVPLVNGLSNDQLLEGLPARRCCSPSKCRKRGILHCRQNASKHRAAVCCSRVRITEGRLRSRRVDTGATEEPSIIVTLRRVIDVGADLRYIVNLTGVHLEPFRFHSAGDSIDVPSRPWG